MTTLIERRVFCQAELTVFQMHLDLLSYVPDQLLTLVDLIHRGDYVQACCRLESLGFMKITKMIEVCTSLARNKHAGTRMVICPITRKFKLVKDRTLGPGLYARLTDRGIAEIEALITSGLLRRPDY